MQRYPSTSLSWHAQPVFSPRCPPRVALALARNTQHVRRVRCVHAAYTAYADTRSEGNGVKGANVYSLERGQGGEPMFPCTRSRNAPFSRRVHRPRDQGLGLHPPLPAMVVTAPSRSMRRILLLPRSDTNITPFLLKQMPAGPITQQRNSYRIKSRPTTQSGEWRPIRVRLRVCT